LISLFTYPFSAVSVTVSPHTSNSCWAWGIQRATRSACRNRFEAFFTTRSIVGTGIGLFVAKQFIEGHGGQIEIDSRQSAEDHGTTVRVFPPIPTTYEPSGYGAVA
jgi:light-regulated signal transduction histidine kinase (bacteriophytochrome)